MNIVISMIAVLIAILATGCTSTSFHMSPKPPDNVSWTNQEMRPGKINIVPNSMGSFTRSTTIDFAMPDRKTNPNSPPVDIRHSIASAINHEYAKANINSPPYVVNADVFISINEHGWWTLLPVFATLNIMPLMLTTEEEVWGTLTALDENNTVISSRQIPRYRSKLSSYRSVTFPTAFLGLTGMSDYSGAGLEHSETRNIIRKVNEPQNIVVRILLSEINNMTIPQPRRTSDGGRDPQSSPISAEERLRRIKRLFDDKIITDEEYREQKATILREL